MARDNSLAISLVGGLKVFKTQVDLGSCSPDELRKVIKGQNEEILLLRKTNKVLLELFSQNEDLKAENSRLRSNVNQLSEILDEKNKADLEKMDGKEGSESS